MNEIACLIKEPTKPAKYAVIDFDDDLTIKDIIGADSIDDINAVVFKRAAVIHNENGEKDHRTYNCSIRGRHFYGTVIIAGATSCKIHDIILTPGFIEKYIPAEDKYERTV